MLCAKPKSWDISDAATEAPITHNEQSVKQKGSEVNDNIFSVRTEVQYILTEAYVQVFLTEDHQ